MGAFIVNLHVRTNRFEDVKSELEALGVSRAYLSPVKGGWLAIYDENCSSQDTSQITSLACHVSERLVAPVIAFLVHDSDFFCYWLCDRGELLDYYNSCPGYFGESYDDSPPRDEEANAQIDLLVEYTRDGVSRKQVEDLLCPSDDVDGLRMEPAMAEDTLRALAAPLGIDVELATIDFRDFGSDCDADEMGLVFVGTGTPPDHTEIRSVPKPDLSNPQSAFADAAARNDVDKIHELAAEGLDLNALDPFYKRPALLIATQCGSIDVVKTLLRLGADVDASDEHGSTAVFNAVSSNNSDMLRLLISCGADLQAANLHVGSPLAWSIQYDKTDCALLLLQAGVDPSLPDLDGETLLHRAVEAENIRVVDQLIQCGANVNIENRKRKKPLDVLEERWELWADRLEEEELHSSLTRRIKGHLSRLKAIRRFLTGAMGD
jgi:ankyrin repeat protein